MKMNYKIILAIFAWMLAPSLIHSAVAANIDSIDFKSQGPETLVEISGNALSGFAKEEKKSPPQLVLTFDNATLADQAKQKFDTSALGGGVEQISSYMVDGGKARVVVDFANKSQYSIEETDAKITLHVNNGGAVAKADKSDAPPPADTSASSTSTKTPAQGEKIADNDAISTVMSGETTQKFTGSPITLKLKDADVHDVLRMISDASGFNIIVHPSVQGKLTLSLDHVPWDQALDVVLTTLKLGAERNESVLRVMPKDMLIREKQDEIDQKKLVAVATPRITRVFPISYADMAQLAGLLQTYANSQNNTPGASGIPTTILVDQNTQSLIIRDTTENVERMRKMIQLLDVQTPQVLIETKTVEASESFNRDLEGQFGLGTSHWTGNINGPATAATGLAGNAGQSATASGSTGSGSARQNGLNILIGGAYGINAQLTYQESISKVKVVSSPKTVVLSGKTSSINQVTAYSITNTNQGSVGVAATTTTVSASANTKMDVTPRVTNDGSIFMKLNLSRDVLNLSNPTAPIAEPRTLTTEVIVDSGSTLVIGGILNIDENHTEEGIPWLRNIPILGALFGSNIDQNTKSELMFFVTPRILNQKRTALGTSVDNNESPKI
jgi:type IV pilus assembly protein PilQ